MIAAGLFTGVIDNVVRTIVLKGRSNMHTLVTLVASFGGIGLFGIMGVFIGPVLASIGIALLQAWPDIGRRFGLLPVISADQIKG
jgi:predicted PurR-regulated permease PerM